MVSGTFAGVTNPLIQVSNNLPNSKPYIEEVNKSDEGAKYGVVNNGVAEWFTVADSAAYRTALKAYIESTFDLTPFNDINEGGGVDFVTLPSEWTEI